MSIERGSQTHDGKPRVLKRSSVAPSLFEGPQGLVKIHDNGESEPFNLGRNTWNQASKTNPLPEATDGRAGDETIADSSALGYDPGIGNG